MDVASLSCALPDESSYIRRPAPIQITAAQAGTGSNHAISSLKFGIIKEFLNLGWSVLLSDVDIVVIQASRKQHPT